MEPVLRELSHGCLANHLVVYLTEMFPWANFVFCTGHRTKHFIIASDKAVFPGAGTAIELWPLLLGLFVPWASKHSKEASWRNLLINKCSLTTGESQAEFGQKLV